MSVRVLFCSEEDRAALYDSVTGTAFGPVIEGTQSEFADGVAESFIRHLDALGQRDPRTLSPETLTSTYVRWRSQLPEAEVA